MMDVAIIIVTWNVRDLIGETLRSVRDDLAHSTLSARIIVVDSASSDDTVRVVRDHFPDVTVIVSADNLGFGKANNLGMRHLGFGTDDTDLPRAVYLLNPDTITQRGATQTLFDALMADARNGVVGARLTFGDGSLQHAGFAFPGLRQLWAEFFPTPGRWIEGRFNGRYPREAYAGQRPFEVDFVLGATMMLRREVIQQTGMFDPEFFMYAEEVDWQWRICKAGWRILCVPQAHVVHLVGQSTGQVKPRSVKNLWESRLYLFKKHYPVWKYHLARWLVARGMARKIRQAHAQNAPTEIVDAYRHVQQLARV